MRVVFSAIGLVALSAATVWAETYVVNPDGTGDYPTIQAAIDAAEPGDVVGLSDGTFTGNGNRDIDFLGKAITVRSQSGDPEACIIDCQASYEDNHRGVVFQSGEPPEARLEALTVANGYIQDMDDPWPNGAGGGILTVNGSAPTIDGVILLNNTAQDGGGMFNWVDSLPNITNCQFVGNTAGTPTWWGIGGGLYYPFMAGNISDCVFRENNAGHYGGGLVLQSIMGPVTVERCEFYDNWAADGGGGFESSNCSPVSFVDCTFARNGTDGYGGGADIYLSHCEYTNCTFVENWVMQGGGGIWAPESSAVLLYTIIAFSSQGESLRCIPGGEASVNCCDLYGNAGGDWVTCIADQADVPGNMSEDPLFCGNGNPDAPYTLAGNSPCGPSNYPCSLIGAWPLGCGVTGIQPSLTSNTSVVVHDAVPNPFNPQTTITFSLGRDDRAVVCIYEVTGRKVAALADRIFTAGTHSLTWNGRDAQRRAMPTGTYIVRLETESGVEARKVMLLR